MDEGRSVKFNCSATGVGASNFTYQWFLNREPWTGDGQNTPVLNIDAVSVHTTGDYTCSVQSPYGGIGRSEKATLILNGNCIAKHSHFLSYYMYTYVDQFCRPVTQKYPGQFSINWKEINSGVTLDAPCDAPKLNGQICSLIAIIT